MGNRLSRIYTRTGDQGDTGLADGNRISKNDPLIHCIGEIDELNSHIGLILTSNLPPHISQMLTEIQHQLFNLGAELAMPDYQALDSNIIDSLEKAMDQLNEKLPALKEFILPGGCVAAAQTHVARSVCRRAERQLLAFDQYQSTHLQFLNRLSDYLFVAARALNQAEGREDVFWRHER